MHFIRINTLYVNVTNALNKNKCVSGVNLENK